LKGHFEAGKWKEKGRKGREKKRKGSGGNNRRKLSPPDIK